MTTNRNEGQGMSTNISDTTRQQDQDRAAQRRWQEKNKNTPRYRTRVCRFGIIARCNNPKSKDYTDYGGRGIRVCKRWVASLDNFIADMGEAPLGQSIDRIDNDGDYEPNNCRWAGATEQANNRRGNQFLTFNGETLTYSQWAREIGLKRGTLRSRIVVSGWSIEKALTTPVGRIGHNV